MNRDAFWFVLAMLALQLLAAQSAEAASPEHGRLYLGAYTKHWGTSASDLNENHKLVAYEGDGWMAGTFENSFGDRTQFAAAVARGHWTEHLDAIALAGVSYGYKDCFARDPDGDSQHCLMGGAGVQYTRYWVEPALLFMGNHVMATASVRF